MEARAGTSHFCDENLRPGDACLPNFYGCIVPIVYFVLIVMRAICHMSQLAESDPSTYEYKYDLFIISFTMRARRNKNDLASVQFITPISQ
jgi:hypothetical protein